MAKQRPMIERLAVALRSDQLRALFRDAIARLDGEPRE
jgi:hypothetical protein